MASKKRKVVVWTLGLVTGGVVILLAIYSVAILRPTGYDQVRQAKMAGGAEARAELDKIIKLLPTTAPQPTASANNRGSYQQLAQNHWSIPYARYDEEVELAERVTASARQRYSLLLQWEAFPHTYDDAFMTTVRGGLASSGVSFPLASGLTAQDFIIPDGAVVQTQWRFVHRALEGDEPGAMEALAEWVSAIRGSIYWELAPWHLHENLATMNDHLAALEDDAPRAAFELIDAMIEEQLSVYKDSGMASRIDASLRLEVLHAEGSGLGEGGFEYFLGGFFPKARKSVLMPLLKKEIERMAVAALNGDMKEFLAARDSYYRIKKAFPEFWSSSGIYSEELDFQALDEEELTQFFSSVWENPPDGTQWEENIRKGIDHWLEETDQQDELIFHRFVLKAIQHRHNHGGWPREEELEDTINDGTTFRGVIWMEEWTPFLRVPRNSDIEASLDAYHEAASVSGPLTPEKLLPFVSEELVPAVTARFFQAEARPVFYTSSPKIHPFGGGRADMVFVPTRFSDAFRRFMRGEHDDQPSRE